MNVIKTDHPAADRYSEMIISNEQVRLARAYLQTSFSTSPGPLYCEVSPDLLVRVTEVLSTLPECREDRVTEARDRFAVTPPSAEEIADKMIGRIISDSLR